MKNSSGQTTTQLLVPLIILLIIAAAFAFMMPELSTPQVFALGGGIVFLIVCLASTEAALYILIFSKYGRQESRTQADDDIISNRSVEGRF